MLTAYAAHAAASAELSIVIAKIEVDIGNLALLDKLSRMRARETAAMVRLASRLKLLPTRTEAPLSASVPWMQDGR